KDGELVGKGQKRKRSGIKHLQITMFMFHASILVRHFRTDVRPNDVKKLRDRLYKVADKQRQDTIIASLVITKNVTRRRPNNPNQNKSLSSGSQHAFSVSYFITSNRGRSITVCENNFIAITKIGRTRLAKMVSKVYAGEPIEEKRGGDRKSHLSVNKKTRGHSFLPADGIFGRVEKILRKNVTITSKEQYYELYEKVGVVKILGTDWKLFNTKSLNVYCKNLPFISELKRIVLEKSRESVKVKGFKNCYFEDRSEQSDAKLLKKTDIVLLNHSQMKKTTPEPAALSGYLRHKDGRMFGPQQI
ncbi:hypothetical protein AVEN_2928-2-1, partial [Araneus ventricosus]